MGKKSSSYQEIDPNVGKAMKKQAELAEQYQEWYQSEMYPMLMRQTEQANEWAMEDAAWARDQARWLRDYTQQNADKQNERADAQYAALKNTWGAEEGFLDSAVNNFDEAAYRERATEATTGDLTMAYAQQRKALGQGMTGSGVDPTSGRYQSSYRTLTDEEAYNRAQAILAAEQTAKELGWNNKMQAVSMGQNYLNGSVNYGNTANSTLGMGSSQALGANALANQLGQLGLSNTSNLYNSYSSNSNSLLSQNQNIFNLGMGNSNINLSSSIAANQNAATMAQGYGSAFGSVAGLATNMATTKMNTGSWAGK